MASLCRESVIRGDFHCSAICREYGMCFNFSECEFFKVDENSDSNFTKCVYFSMFAHECKCEEAIADIKTDRKLEEL